MDKPDINTHFRKESKIMIGVLLLPIIISAIMVLIWPLIFPVTKIDICLDNGGSFDYVNCKCDFQNSHESKEEHLCK